MAPILLCIFRLLRGPERRAVFPATTLQTCIVHLIRKSLDYASWKDRKGLAQAIKPIYTAPSAEAAEAELTALEGGPWGQKFPTVVAAWRRAWDKVIPFFAFPPGVRKVVYTTNAIESINARLRKMGPRYPELEGGNEPVVILYADRFTKAARDMRHRLAHRVGRSSQATPAARGQASEARRTQNF